jgi:hypothetical protein
LLAVRFKLVKTVLCASLLAILPAVRTTQAACSNPVACENQLPGDTDWQISGSGNADIQGFSTDISVNVGQTVFFKISTNASNYSLDIYRMGYYGGAGARKVATVNPSVSLPQTQPACLTNAATKLTDCGNWAISASWTVPATAVSGIYFAHLVRPDNGHESHIFFVVRNDASHSDVLFQASDQTWAAYNNYGGFSFYGDTGWNLSNRAYKVSYNRPSSTRNFEAATFIFNAEYPMVRWLEANGYDVSYFTCVDAVRNANLITNHKLYLSVGHDEYTSTERRASLEAARGAGVNLAFFSGNEVFWKTRWENSIDGSNTPYRTMVCYKETFFQSDLGTYQKDPNDPPTWTGTWRDPRFSPPADGGKPENALTGTIFMVNGPGPDNTDLSIQVPAADGKMRFWRNTSIANLSAGQTAVLPAGTLGYEWDADIDNGARPAGLVPLSTSTYAMTDDLLLDFGVTYGAGNVTHHLTLYRAPSGALVFGAGTVQWAWGLDSNHDGGNDPADVRMQQATVNLFADMSVQPTTLQAGLVTATKSTDTTPPTSAITSPPAGSSVPYGSPVTLMGTATDSGGGVVGAIEVSVDGGTTWHPATGRSQWSYSGWTPSTLSGSATVMVRASDDSANIQTTPSSVNYTIGGGPTCPCSVWNSSAAPATATTNDSQPIEVGMKFRSDVSGFITSVRFYKGSGNTGTHVGHLWSSTGTNLGTVSFTNETASGWQQADFPSPILISANTTYIISYYAPNGGYSSDEFFFGNAGVNSPPLHALKSGVDGGNGVYLYGTGGGFPTNTFDAENYWIDVVFTTTKGPIISGVTATAGTTSATITWSTDVPSTSRVDYGTSPSALNLNLSDPSMTSSHSLSLSNLTPGTNYYFRVTSVDSSSNSSTSPPTNTGPASFATTPLNAPPAISAVAAIPNSSSAQITWNTNVQATSRVDFGTSPSSLTSTVSDPTLVTSHTVTLIGLTAGTTYYYRVTSADASNNSATFPTSGNQPLSFTTCPCSVWNNATVPGTPEDSDSSSVELGMRFRTDVDGFITGVRFYKGAGNTGVHLGNLWTDAGTNLGTLTFTNETASGWQQASFPSPIPVSANTTYVVSYYAPNGHYAADASFFATKGVDQPPLHALINSVSDSNGTYVYAVGGGFPSSTFNSTNYWVDVVFTTSSTNTWTISGTITGPGGNGATVTLGNTANATTTADSAGNYRFTGLANGPYTVTPTSPTYAFNPATASVTVNSANVTVLAFTTVTYTISGNAGTDGATVSLSGDAGGTATSDASGNYTFTGLGNGNYTVTPTKAGFAFQPASRSVTVNGGDVSVPGFTATAGGSTWSLSGTIGPSPGVSGVTLNLTGAATASTTSDSSGNYSFGGLLNGTYTVTPSKAGFTFSPTNQTVTINSVNMGGVSFTATASTGISIDATTWVDRGTNSTTITSPSFSTTSGNELLLAFVATDWISGTNTVVSSVTGAGLTWALVVRTNTQSGTSEIWRTFAPSSLTNVTVRATLSRSVAASMTVMSFKGVPTTGGTNGSQAIGAIGRGNARPGAPTASLVTTRNNSWVFGVGNDYDNAISRTLGSGQTMVHQNLSPAGDTYWVQRRNNPTPASGTTVTIDDTAPTGDRYNLSICEILAGP